MSKKTVDLFFDAKYGSIATKLDPPKGVVINTAYITPDQVEMLIYGMAKLLDLNGKEFFPGNDDRLLGVIRTLFLLYVEVCEPDDTPGLCDFLKDKKSSKNIKKTL